MSYTKGPWTIETPCGFPYSGLYVVPVIRKDFPCHIAQIRQLREREESEANACLIAAAPKLLDACKFAKSQIKKGAQKKALPILRTAIAEAEKGVKNVDETPMV